MDSVGNNRYELLFDDDDAVAQLPPAAVEKKKQPAAAPKKTPSSAKKTGLQAEKENLSKEQQGNKKSQPPQAKFGASATRNKNPSTGPNETGRNVTFKPDRDLREARNNRRNIKESEVGNVGGGIENSNQRQFKERDNRNRDGNFRSGKREFDRQSGSDKTGVKSVAKRDGAGAHNWGSVKQEIEDVAITATEADGIDKEDSTNEQSGEATNPPEEEEVKEMTLDEWKALTQQREKPKYNIRKPGEGEDTAQWKKMVVLNKKKEGETGSEEELEYDPSMYPQRVGRLQRIVDIQFNFKDGRRGGGNFGRGRRGPRPGFDDKSNRNETVGTRNNSGRPRNNFNERPRGAASNLKVDYERQFPTLS